MWLGTWNVPRRGTGSVSRCSMIVLKIPRRLPWPNRAGSARYVHNNSIQPFVKTRSLTERKVQGLSLVKSRPLGCSAVAAPESDHRSSSDTSETREREWRKERRGDGMTTPPSAVDGCAEPSVDSMAPQESGVIAWRHRFRRRRARLAPSSSRPILL